MSYGILIDSLPLHYEMLSFLRFDEEEQPQRGSLIERPLHNLLRHPSTALRGARNPHVPKYIPVAELRVPCLWGARYDCAEVSAIRFQCRGLPLVMSNSYKYEPVGLRAAIAKKQLNQDKFCRICSINIEILTKKSMK